MVEIRV